SSRLLPGLAAVIGALDDLPEPAAGLGAEDAVWVGGRALDVVDLPAGEVGAGDVPLLALGVGVEDERAFLGADKDADTAHGDSPEKTNAEDTEGGRTRRKGVDRVQNPAAFSASSASSGSLRVLLGSCRRFLW